MAYRHAGNSTVEYCLCGSLIAIAALSALAGFGTAVSSTIQGVGAQLGALQSGQSGQLSTSPQAPAAFQTAPGLTNQTGAAGSVTGSANGPIASGNGALNPGAAAHAPTVETAGANGTLLHAQTGATDASPSTAPAADESSSSTNNVILPMVMPVSKTNLSP